MPQKESTSPCRELELDLIAIKSTLEILQIAEDISGTLYEPDCNTPERQMRQVYLLIEVCTERLSLCIQEAEFHLSELCCCTKVVQ
jgi:hypothetical protein